MTVSRDSGIVAAQCFEGPVRIVKCLMYLVFFVIIMSCAFASKVSLLVLTTGAGDERKVSWDYVPATAFSNSRQRTQPFSLADKNPPFLNHIL